MGFHPIPDHSVGIEHSPLAGAGDGCLPAIGAELVGERGNVMLDRAH